MTGRASMIRAGEGKEAAFVEGQGAVKHNQLAGAFWSPATLRVCVCVRLVCNAVVSSVVFSWNPKGRMRLVQLIIRE